MSALGQERTLGTLRTVFLAIQGGDPWPNPFPTRPKSASDNPTNPLVAPFDPPPSLGPLPVPPAFPWFPDRPVVAVTPNPFPCLSTLAWSLAFRGDLPPPLGLKPKAVSFLPVHPPQPSPDCPGVGGGSPATLSTNPRVLSPREMLA